MKVKSKQKEKYSAQFARTLQNKKRKILRHLKKFPRDNQSSRVLRTLE